MCSFDVYLSHGIGVFVVAFACFHHVLKVFSINELLNFASSFPHEFSIHHNSWALHAYAYRLVDFLS